MTNKKSLLRLTIISCFLFASGSLFGQWNGDGDSSSSFSAGSSSLSIVADTSDSATAAPEVIAPAIVPAKEEKAKKAKSTAVYVSRYRHGNKAE